VLLAGAVLLAVLLAAAVLLAGESSRAMLVSARLSYFVLMLNTKRFEEAVKILIIKKESRLSIR